MVAGVKPLLVSLSAGILAIVMLAVAGRSGHPMYLVAVVLLVSLMVWKAPSTALGLAMLFGTCVLIAWGAPWLVTDFQDRLPQAHLLGTDPAGRDVFVLLLKGYRESLGQGLIACVIANVVAWLVGIAAESPFAPLRLLCAFLMTTFLAFPVLILLLVWLSLGLQERGSLGLGLGLLLWAEPARLVQAHVGSLIREPFVLAARLKGQGPLLIAWRQFLPNLRPTIVVNVMVVWLSAVLLEAVLGYLGLVQHGLGRILAMGVERMDRNPLIMILAAGLLILWIGSQRALIHLMRRDARLDIAIQ